MNAYQEWRTLRTPPPPPTGALARAATRALAIRHERARAARIAALERDLRQSGDRLAWSCAGAPTDSWGVLSGVGGQGMEDTLRSFAWDSDEDVQRTARDLAAGLALVRAHAELGDRDHIRLVEQMLLQLINTPGLSREWRRRLIDHLPSSLRPLPASLKELFRSQPPVTLYVTMHGPDQSFHYAESPLIELNDIVVPASLQGQGIGSAALAELCVYADHHQLPIQGKIEPGAGKPDEAVTALAHWYYKRGFRQDDRHPDQWRRHGLIRREPLHADSTD